ncbi:septation protein SepH [Cryobacterium tepidiphilum]|uniref:DUF3071 domain-containing protein n=1 Tax=Cryobacterium tepidiphilum TaxID=2486026 RepID=A0A3M8LM58_9MICO|nr:septation protein SepH [Cryobacterium tepidiphilum]RNE66603.1 DUF3071 domain-containing protein [Cryobacterium tepidiphilum]
MQELKVIGVENGALLAASEEGDRFRIVIDEVLQSRIRQSQADSTTGPKLSPKEIQAHIRSGMSADDVAAVTGASVEYVRRFEGPIVAEREHMVASALSVPVHASPEPDPADEEVNFGTVIRERLASLGAQNERWASWKEPDAGWIVKVSFTADEIDHDARWSFDPKKNLLSPLGGEAIALSQQGELKGGLIPRLRAVGPDTGLEASRFDSAAFTFKEPLTDEAPEAAGHVEPIPYGHKITTTDAVSRAAIKRADEPAQGMSETADLLKALRRRRGEREAAGHSEHGASHGAASEGGEAAPRTGPVQVLEETAPYDISSLNESVADEAPAPAKPGAEPPAAAPQARPNIWAATAAKAQARNAGGGHAKRGRASMPSWDEIVFGARTTDDDPA